MISKKKKRFAQALIVFTIATTATALSFAMPHKTPKTGKSKQQQFINFMLEEVNSINEDILAERETLLALESQYQKNKKLSTEEHTALQSLAERYEVESFNPAQSSQWKTLKTRIDIIPPSLAIAQAATESGWGKSRFAQLANNYFGHSCFKRGCGLAPTKRLKGPYFEAKKFSSPTESIRSYINNLNTHNAYSKLRTMRYEQRMNDKPPQGLQLATGLHAYASTGQKYVKYIQQMIKNYDLHEFDDSLD